MKTKVLNLTYSLILILAVLYVGWDIATQPGQEQQAPTPTPVPTVAQKTNPPVLYDKDSNDRMLDLLAKRPPLSASDSAVKTKLKKLITLPKKTSSYTMEYIPTPDEFMVEIKTVNINQAKEESVAWLRTQGLSDEGICRLPLAYYLNSGVANNLRGINMRFNPLAPGC